MEQSERSGQLIKGKWRIDGRLGDGSTASVYAATHRNGYRVAVKVLHSDLAGNAEIRTRFLREGYVANTIRHPGVVRILDDDVMDDGAVFLVMELLEGETLETRAMRFGGKLPLDDVIPTMDRLLDVLAAAHAQGIVHRDVKPDNVFLTKDGGLKVLDFGLARISEQFSSRMATRAGLVLGTPDFMSPEQASGNSGAVDARSDLWSVGATAFTLLTGEPVHKSATLHEYLMVISSVPARSLSVAAPNVPRSVVEVIDRSLALDRAHRWGSAREMQGALREAYPITSSATSLETGVVIQRPTTPTSIDQPIASSFNRDITMTELAGSTSTDDSPDGEDPVNAAPTLNEFMFDHEEDERANQPARDGTKRMIPNMQLHSQPRMPQPPTPPMLRPMPQPMQPHARPMQPVMPQPADRDFSDFSSVTTTGTPATSWLPRILMLTMLIIFVCVAMLAVAVKKKGLLHRPATGTSAPATSTR